MLFLEFSCQRVLVKLCFREAGTLDVIARLLTDQLYILARTRDFGSHRTCL